MAACLIVRNGAQTIERFLASVRPHVDEVCVYLAGESTDGTPEILDRAAAQPGAPIRVQEGEWRDDYAEARNCSFAMASSDYLAWFDDDEILEGGEHLQPMLARSLTRPEVVNVFRVDVWETDRVSILINARIVRADLGIRWVSPVHEIFDPAAIDRAAIRVALPQLVRIIHAPITAPGRHQYRKLVERTFARTGDRRLGLYVAKYLAGDDQNDTAAVAVLESIIAKPGTTSRDRGLVVMAHKDLAECLVRLGDPDRADPHFDVYEEWHRERLQDPLIAMMWRLLRENPVKPDDPIWERYADDPRAADPRAPALLRNRLANAVTAAAA